MTAPAAVTCTLPLASLFQPLKAVDRGSGFNAMVGPVLAALGKPDVDAVVVVEEGVLATVGVEVAVVVVDVVLVGAGAVLVRVFFGAQVRRTA